MRRVLGLSVAWLGATVLSVVIASTAVAGIRDRVVETPAAIGAPTTTTTTTAPEATPTTIVVLETTTSSTTTSTTQPAETTTTVAESQTTTSTTSAPETTTSTTTTTTAAPPAHDRKTYSLVGGTVVIEFGGDEIWVVSAVPNSGFYSDIEKKGPDEIKVEFESNDHKSQLSGHLEDGEPKVSTSEDGEGDDGGEHDD